MSPIRRIASSWCRRGSSGRLDLLINNASDLGGSPLTPLRDLEPEAYEQLLRTNVIAPQQLIGHCCLAAPQTVIINVSSDAGVEHYETWGGYGSSKAALDHQTLTWAAEEPTSGGTAWTLATCALPCTRRRIRARTSAIAQSRRR